MKIKGAIFDMDGTLIDSLFFWPVFWKTLGKKYLHDDNFNPEEEIDKTIRTMLFVDALKLINDRYRFTDDLEALVRFANESVIDFYKTQISLKDGTVAFLEHLKSKGVKMCLASATEMALIQSTLAQLGIAHYFECVLSCADLGVGKDRPDIYLLASKNLGFAPEELCVFEDSFVALETARAAGFHTVGIFDPYNFAQDRLCAASDFYLGKGKSLALLAEVVNAD